MPAISNIDIYNYRMERGMEDKLFFVEYIQKYNINVFIDFGCANAALINSVHNIFPDLLYIGFDINPDMLKLASQMAPYAHLFSDWNRLMSFIKKENIGLYECILNISSVIHEVYSYGTDNDIAVFWNRVLNSGFKYISIRDMCYSSINFDKDVTNKLISIFKTKYRKQYNDYVNIWGDFNSKNILEFLLKYKYIENWDREIKEDYLPISYEKFLKTFNKFHLNIVYKEHYTLPFTKEQIKTDFNMDLNIKTHCKFFLVL